MINRTHVWCYREMVDANWLIVLVGAVAAIIALWAAGSARRSANAAAKSAKAADDLVAVEREKLRRAAEPSFRAEYLMPQQKIAFKMVTGPTDICEVTGFPVFSEGEYVKVDSSFTLGRMQIGDTREVEAAAIHGRPKGDLQQEFLLEVKWRDNHVPVSVFCSIPPDLDVMIAFV